jgi:hypothetical protein
METYVHLCHLVDLFSECEMFQTKAVKKIKTNINVHSTLSENRAVNAIKREIVVQPTDDKVRWHMRVAWWINKTTDTHSEYIILIKFTRKQQLCERASLLRYTYISYRVYINLDVSTYKGDGLASLMSKSFTFLKTTCL